MKVMVGVMTLIGLIITNVLVPFVKANTTEKQRNNAYTIVKTAVLAAEQMQNAGLISIPKKDFVLEYVIVVFEKKGIKISYEDIEVMLEAAVKEIK